ARVDVIPHPSEPRAVIPDRAAARARLGVPADVPLFLFSGILRPYKGWDVLLEAFAAGRREVPEAQLVLAGESGGSARDVPALAAAMVRFVREGLGPRLSAGDAHRRAVFTPDAHARRVLSAGGIDV